LEEKTVIDTKVERLERDVDKMQSTCESRGEKLSELDKSTEISKVYQRQIMENLAAITLNIAKMTGSVAETLINTNSLKIVTDKQTIDIKTIGDKVEIIEKLPIQNSRRFMWLVIATAVANGAGLLKYLLSFL